MEINKIYNGDAYELIKQLPDKSVDLVITDPPYEIVGGGSGGCFGVGKRDYHAEYKVLSRDNHKREGLRINANANKMKKDLNCICAGFDYSLLDELDRVMKSIYIYIYCNKNQISSLMKHYEEKGCNVDLLVWCKTNPIPTCNNKYLSDLEYCVFAREKNAKLGGTYKTKSKYFISSANVEDKGKYQHPCCKPIEMLSNFIINSTNEGDVVLDCFMGSGSVMVAAKRLNRKYIGFEIEEKWYKVAQDRLQGIDQNGNMNLFDIPTD